MTSTVCGFCKRFTHMTPLHAHQITMSGGIKFLQGLSRCDACGRASMGFGVSPDHRTNESTENRFSRIPDDEMEWWPKAGEAPQIEDVPEHIAIAAREAHSTASIGARMAAVLMARTVVEATAKEKGIKSGLLVGKIDALEAAGHIRASTKDAAHEIRHLGNEMAHGDIKDVPSPEDASEVLMLMDEVLNEVFQGPARTARIKAKRITPPAAATP